MNYRCLFVHIKIKSSRGDLEMGEMGVPVTILYHLADLAVLPDPPNAIK